MATFFFIIGTLAALSGGREYSSGHNIALSILAVGCFACVVAVEKL